MPFEVNQRRGTRYHLYDFRLNSSPHPLPPLSHLDGGSYTNALSDARRLGLGEGINSSYARKHAARANGCQNKASPPPWITPPPPAPSGTCHATLQWRVLGSRPGRALPVRPGPAGSARCVTKADRFLSLRGSGGVGKRTFFVPY